jgi:large subunit ribosomal protein L21
VRVAGADGEIYKDPRIGPVYRKPPAEIDDLLEIKGVGEVIRKKLHRAGIYTFRQIASWRPRQIKALSEDLKLSDRVKRDQWQRQARVRHRVKYHERL